MMELVLAGRAKGHIKVRCLTSSAISSRLNFSSARSISTIAFHFFRTLAKACLSPLLCAFKLVAKPLSIIAKTVLWCTDTLVLYAFSFCLILALISGFVICLHDCGHDLNAGPLRITGSFLGADTVEIDGQDSSDDEDSPYETSIIEELGARTLRLENAVERFSSEEGSDIVELEARIKRLASEMKELNDDIDRTYEMASSLGWTRMWEKYQDRHVQGVDEEEGDSIIPSAAVMSPSPLEKKLEI
jgi:hypothetical protein